MIRYKTHQSNYITNNFRILFFTIFLVTQIICIQNSIAQNKIDFQNKIFITDYLRNRVRFTVTPEIDSVHLHSEPKYTQGTSNWIYFDSIGDNVNTDEDPIPSDSCVIEIEASTDRNFSDLIDIAIVHTSEKNAKFPGFYNPILFQKTIDQPIYYRARILIPEREIAGEWSIKDCWSIQDTTAPQKLISMKVIPNLFNSNIFQEKCEILFEYYVSDPAGIKEITLHNSLDSTHWDMLRTIYYDSENVNGDTGFTSIHKTEHITVGEGTRLFSFICEDNAYTPDSHEFDTSSWKRDGNINTFIPWDTLITVVIDSVQPICNINIIPEDLTNNTKCVYDKNIKIHIYANDSYGIKYLLVYDNGENPEQYEFNSKIIDKNISYNLTNTKNHILKIECFDRVGNKSVDYDTVDYITSQKFIAFPNPFNPENTRITIRASNERVKEIKIYDLFGDPVCTLIKESGSARLFFWNGRNDKGDMVSNGGYLCVSGETNEVFKIAVLKE